MSILIKNTTLITMNKEKDILKEVDILIEGNKIKYIGQNCNEEADKIIDASEFITMPGLINTHTHIPMSLFRNYADDLPFWEWLYERILPLEVNLEAEHVYWGSMLSMAEMIRSGITSFSDMYFFVESIAKATKQTGMRGFLSLSVTDGEDSREESLRETKQTIETLDGTANGRITVRIAPHAPYSCSDEFLKNLVELSNTYDKGINIHVAESEQEMKESFERYGMSPVERLNELGVLKKSTIAVHCVNLSDDDIDLLKQTETSVSNNPGSNLKLGNGFARVDDLLKKGVNVALGTDGAASNNNLNMFEEITLASLINKGVTKDPQSVSAQKSLEMATIDGARALGVESELGSVEVGKKADIILIDTNKPHFYPRHNEVSSLVYSAQASDVDTVIVDGVVLMEKRELLTINLTETLKTSEKMAKDLLK